jgi:hypothetical protein
MLMLASKQKRGKWKGHACCLRKLSLDKSSHFMFIFWWKIPYKHVLLTYYTSAVSHGYQVKKPLRDFLDSTSLLISVIHFSIFFRGHLPLPQKRPHIEKYYPFPRYKIKPTNGSECTKFHFPQAKHCL